MNGISSDVNSYVKQMDPFSRDTSRTNFQNDDVQKRPKFEAYMMTGERVLNLTKNPPRFQRRMVEQQKEVNQNLKFKSMPSSPVESESASDLKACSAGTSPVPNVAIEKTSPFTEQTSQSDEHMQHRESARGLIDDDATCSVDTLLDANQKPDKKVLWTYHTDDSSNSMDNSSPQRSVSPPSPTSVSSSIMSSVSNSSVDRKRPQGILNSQSEVSHSEGLSNISSPDYQEESCDILSNHDYKMELTDPSDSDSTFLASEPKVRRTNKCVAVGTRDAVSSNSSDKPNNHRIVIQVKGVDNRYPSRLGYYSSLQEEEDDSDENKDQKKNGYENLNECDDELLALTEGAANLAKAVSPPHSASSEEEISDVESLRSFHFSPKAVDYPSAVRLAKRLYNLDGFKKSDVSRHLCKNNDFSRVVAEEFLKHFNFTNDTLDVALRKFLGQFSLTGETQERERVLVYFSKRYLECNPGSFASQDAVHTLTCAIMLLNTDLHGKMMGRRMTCNAFIQNLAGLNDDDDFPKEILKSIYHAIKSQPLEWASDDDTEDLNAEGAENGHNGQNYDNQNNPLKHIQPVVSHKNYASDVYTSYTDYKKGYVMRKCCMDPNGKKTPLGKRCWKMFYCTLRGLMLFFHKDEQGFKKSQMSDNSHSGIKVHHALASEALDYTKKLYVFRMQTADRAEYLFQTSDRKELQSWIDTINVVSASLSAPALPAPVGSQKKFQRPLLPSAPTTLGLREQLAEHERTVERLKRNLLTHRKHPPEKGAKTLIIQNYKEKDVYLNYELKRYETYVDILRSRIPPLTESTSSSFPDMDNNVDKSRINEYDEKEDGEDEDDDEEDSSSSNRYSYRAAIYANEDLSVIV